MKLSAFIFLAIFSVVYSNDLPCNCRLGNLNRIVLGKIAAENSVPWMASLADTYDNHFCGASILNKNWVLTAEHCTKGKHGKDITIRVGLHDTEKLDEDRIYFGKRVIHHQFQKPGDIGDFSLIELDEPIEFVPGEIEPACLNLVDEKFPGDLLAAGWGRTARSWRDLSDKDGKMNKVPKDTTMLKYYFSVESNRKCKPHDICIEAKNTGESACQGDSGGPLMQTKNGKTSVIGIASYVSSADQDGMRFFCVGNAAYARLSMYKDLLDKYAVNYCSA